MPEFLSTFQVKVTKLSQEGVNHISLHQQNPLHRGWNIFQLKTELFHCFLLSGFPLQSKSGQFNFDKAVHGNH